MSNGLLMGYAISTKLTVWVAKQMNNPNLKADHTYVTSSHGHVWPCWGRSSGGKLICKGIGDTDLADCLAGPDSTAGIIYGVTGVCHQTANRILYPANTTVSPADGYLGSFYAWRTYGRVSFPWRRLKICLASHRQP